jgi:hypothetical protein
MADTQAIKTPAKKHHSTELSKGALELLDAIGKILI